MKFLIHCQMHFAELYLVRAAKNEELAEWRERKLSSCKLMLHGVQESDCGDINERKQLDETW